MADKIVDVDTDNLDDFNDLFAGKATAAPVKNEVPVDDPEDAPDPEANPLAEPTEDVDPAPEEDKGLFVPKRKTVQERINELTAARKEAERREAELQRKVEELTAAKETKTEAPEKTVVVVGEPTPDDTLENGDLKYPLGEYDPKYIRDLTRYTIEQETAAAKAAEAIEQQKAVEAAKEAELNTTREALKADWNDRVTETVESVPDFVEKVQALEDIFTGLDPAYGEYLATTIMSMENGTDVLYHLSNNLAEAQRIASLGPVQATIALGRIEAAFIKADDDAPPAPKVSQAPEPPVIRVRGSSTVHKVAVDTDDLEAFEKEFFKR